MRSGAPLSVEQVKALMDDIGFQEAEGEELIADEFADVLKQTHEVAEAFYAPKTLENLTDTACDFPVDDDPASHPMAIDVSDRAKQSAAAAETAQNAAANKTSAEENIQGSNAANAVPTEATAAVNTTPADEAQVSQTTAGTATAQHTSANLNPVNPADGFRLSSKGLSREEQLAVLLDKAKDQPLEERQIIPPCLPIKSWANPAYYLNGYDHPRNGQTGIRGHVPSSGAGKLSNVSQC